MPYVVSGGTPLYFEEHGAGEPLVLVHGSWGDHSTWAQVVPALSNTMRVIAYDRRGHSRSERGPGAVTRRSHEDDLAEVIEGLGIGPAHVAANSYGAAIALGLAARRPDLFRSLVAHEPPLVWLVDDHPLVTEADARLRAVADRIAAGDTEGGARQFVEEVVLGPGSWGLLPEAVRSLMLSNAGTFPDEQRDLDGGAIRVSELSGIDLPVLLTQGDQSLAWFAPIVARLHDAIAPARVEILAGAGHAPHATHPADFAVSVATFAGAVEPSVR
jgi:pimeloyl-ACP methyl ester carboxylesterase